MSRRKDQDLLPRSSLAPGKDVLAGQAVYSKNTLAVYDFLVLGLSNRFIWKCPTARLIEFYRSHLSANHLDVGVGTGFFLDHCPFPDRPRVVLIDLNPNSLEATAQRIRRYEPRTYRRNVLERLELGEKGFDSIGMNYLLHCLPGDMHAKAASFDHVKAYLNPGGVLFGSTLLYGGVRRSTLAKGLMKFYNAKGIFHNTGDDLEGLRKELAGRFGESRVEVAGCAALFWARN